MKRNYLQEFQLLISSYSFIVYYSRTFIYTAIILSFIRYTFSNTISWTVYNALNLQSFPNYPENLCNNGIKWKPRSNYKIAVNRRTHATQWKRWSEAMTIWHAVETVNWYFAEMVRQSDEHMLSSRDGAVTMQSHVPQWRRYSEAMNIMYLVETVR